MAEELAVELENWEEWLQEVIEELREIRKKHEIKSREAKTCKDLYYNAGVVYGIQVAIRKLTELR